MGFWVYPEGSALELLDGTLKLRHCTEVFTMRFPPWSLPRVGTGGGKRQVGTPGHPSDPGGNLGRRVRLTRKTRPGTSSHVNLDPGHPTPRRWKRLRPPFLRRRGGEVCTGDGWNLPSEGTVVVGFRLVSPAEGTSALALVHFNFVACVCVYGQTCTHYTQSAPQPPPHHNHHHQHQVSQLTRAPFLCDLCL